MIIGKVEFWQNISTPFAQFASNSSCEIVFVIFDMNELKVIIKIGPTMMMQPYHQMCL